MVQIYMMVQIYFVKSKKPIYHAGGGCGISNLYDLVEEVTFS